MKPARGGFPFFPCSDGRVPCSHGIIRYSGCQGSRAQHPRITKQISIKNRRNGRKNAFSLLLSLLAGKAPNRTHRADRHLGSLERLAFWNRRPKDPTLRNKATKPPTAAPSRFGETKPPIPTSARFTKQSHRGDGSRINALCGPSCP
jgi:hypothetical protein